MAAQQRGFVGPGPIGSHIDRALDLAEAMAAPAVRPSTSAAVPGSPGLPLALAWPDTTWIAPRRQHDAGRLPAGGGRPPGPLRPGGRGQRSEPRPPGTATGRGRYALVVARSFAAPAVTAECGSPFLCTGGRLVVAEPPGGKPERWEPEGLAILGLRLDPRLTGRTAYQVLAQERPCPDRFARRVGIPAKRPLF